MVKTARLRLRVGAIIHFLIAMGHVVCLFFLEEAFKAYGIWDMMMQLCSNEKWILYVATTCIAIWFVVAGLYGLSASGDIRKMPLQKLVVIVLVSLYSVRTILGVYWLMSEFSCLQFFSTLIPVLAIYCYLPGLKRKS